MAGLDAVPFLGGFLQMDATNRAREGQQLQQAAQFQTLQSVMQQTQAQADERKRLANERALVSQSGGDLEKAMQALIVSGDTAGAAKLAPLVKIQQEAKDRQATAKGLEAIYNPPQGAVSDAPTPATGQPAPLTARQQRIDQLQKMSLLPAYAANPIASQRIQAEIDRLRQEMKPMIEHNFSVGDNMIQPHMSHDNGNTWVPVPGSKPSAKFAKQVGSTIVNPTPVTVTTVTDPDDPNRTLQVDARTYRGGGIGSPGVIGAGQRLSQAGGNELKLQNKKPEAKRSVDIAVQGIDKLDTALDELSKDEGLSNITGTLFGRTPNLTNTATGAQAKLDNIKANTFTQALQAMRDASKTGGAVGSVSDREGDKLENTLAALSQAQSTEDFQKQLKKARDQLKTSKQIIQRAYEDQFADVPDRAAAPVGGGKRVIRFDSKGNIVQ